MSKLGITRRVRWQYAVGGAIASMCLLGAGIATATELSLDDGSSIGDGSNPGYSYSCDTTITGAHGTVVANSGTTCIIDAQISGSVVVNRPGALVVQNSTISGNIGASGANGTQICGSTVGGTVSISNSTGFVLVGDPANGCAANVIGGSLVVSANHHGVVVIDNTVHGSVANLNNSGSGPLSGQNSPIFSGNHH